MRIPKKRGIWTSGADAPRFIYDGRLVAPGEMYRALIRCRLTPARGDEAAIVQTIAIRLRGRGPNADYLAAVVAGGHSAPPPHPILRKELRRHAYSTSEWRQRLPITDRDATLMALEAPGLKTFVALAAGVVSRACEMDGYRALARELVLPAQVQRGWSTAYYSWLAWRQWTLWRLGHITHGRPWGLE